MMIYPHYRTHSLVIHTLRGAALWLACWATLTAAMLTLVLRWPHGTGIDILCFVIVLIMQVGTPPRS